MKLFRKAICMICLLALSLLTFPMATQGNAQSYTLGSVNWKLEDGCLTVSGSGSLAYGGCPWWLRTEEITQIVIESGITTLEKGVFKGYPNLTSVIVHKDLQHIEAQAFSECKNLETIQLPASLKSIDEDAFFECNRLTSVYISDIAAWCAVDFGYFDANPLFGGAKLYLNGQLVTDLVIPEGIKEIGAYAFYGCAGLRSIVFPDGLEKIGRSAFYNSADLTRISLPGSLQSLGSNAFGGHGQRKLAIFRGPLAKLRKIQYDPCNAEYLNSMIWMQSPEYAMLKSLGQYAITIGIQGLILFIVLRIARKRRLRI